MRLSPGILAALVLWPTAWAEEPSLPVPAKADVPYLLMGDDLLPTEAAEAQQSQEGKKKKQETTYTVPGEHSSAKTPLASPIFMLKQDTLDPQRLEVYAFDVKDGHREVTFSARKAVKSYTVTVKKAGDALYRLEVNESLPAGEYAMTPSGSNQVFCFAVF